MKKMLSIAFAVLLLTGCASSSNTAPEPSAAVTTGVVLPSVVGVDGKAAKKLLEDAGFEVEFDAGEDSVWAPSNWNVDGQIPAAGASAEKGSTVTLAVSKPEAVVPAEPAPVAPVADTPSGLTVGMAITVCDRAGKDASPYGWNADFLLDGTREVQGDAIFLKAGVSVTNEFNAKGRYTVECLVSGSDAAPAIDSFNVY